MRNNLSRQRNRPLSFLAHVAGRLGVVALFAFFGLGSALLIAPVQPASAQPACTGVEYGGVCFPNGAASFADSTVSFDGGPEYDVPFTNTEDCNFVAGGVTTPRGDPNVSPLGPPDDPTNIGTPTLNATPQSLSLGAGGVVVVQFTDNALSGSSVDGAADGIADLWIFESGGAQEYVSVEVSADGGSWISVGMTTGQTGAIDIDAFGFDVTSQLRFVRLTDDADIPAQTPSCVPGADIDAIGAITSVAATDLSITKTADPESYAPGEDVVFTITVTNNGSIPVAGATVSDDVPAEFTDVTWTCAASAGSSCGVGGDSGTGNTIAGTVDVLAGGTITYTVTATAPTTDPPATLSNTADVDVPTGFADSDPSNNTATVDVGLEPVAEDDEATTGTDTPVDIPVLDNDTDPNGGPLTVSPVLPTEPEHGTAVVNPDGTVTYTPDPGYTGPDTFEYEVCTEDDGCTTATVDVVVTDPPVAADDETTTPPETPVDVPVLENDTDPNGEPLTVSPVLPTEPTNGTAVVNPDGTVTYTPDPGYTGPDAFEYEVCNESGVCDTATVEVVVGDPPVATDDEATTPPDAPINVPVLDNDMDPNGEVLTLQPGSVTDPANGTVVENPDGTVTYTPDPGFTGEDSFEYTVCNESGVCDTATVTVDVAEPPVAEDDTVTTPEDSPVDVPVLDNDTVPPGTVPEITTPPTNGDVVVNPDGTVTYTPDPDFTGTDTFEYQVCDANDQCDTATATVTVDPVNDDPEVVDDSVTTDPNTPIDVPVLDNDTDPDGDPLIPSITTPPTDGTAVVNPDGTVTYTPDEDFCGTDSFEYSVDDGNGGTDTGTATVSVTCPENTDPVATDDTATSPAESPVDIPVLDNDTDPDSDPVSVVPGSATDPANGSVVINPDGTITYTPDPGFVGDDTFEYTISDGNGGTDTATVTVTVEPPAAPVTEDDTATTPSDTPIDVPVLDNDTVPDGSVPEITTPPTNGTAVVNPDGTVTYTPNPGYTGPDTFEYQVCDAYDQCDTATATVTVEPPAAPVVEDDTATTPSDTPIDVPVLDNDTVPDGSVPEITTPPTNGTAVVNPDGTVTYTPNPGYSGTDTFEYQVCDAYDQCDTATATVTVEEPVSEPPVAVDDSGATSPGGTVSGSVAINDTDPDTPAEDLTYALDTPPANGTATVNPDGSYTYTPNDGFTGTDTFTYTVTDPDGNTSTATVTIAVEAAPGAPSMTLTKTADTAGPVNIGDVITYTFTVVNTGDVALTNVAVDDPKIGTIDIIASLGVGETATVTATYTVTEDDAAAGNVHNLATVKGLDPEGNEITSIGENNVPACLPGTEAKAPLSDQVLGISVRALQVVPATPEVTETVTEEPTLEPTETVTETATATETATETATATETETATATETVTVTATSEGTPEVSNPDGCETGSTPTPQPTPTPRPGGGGGGGGQPGGGQSGGGGGSVPPVTDLPGTGANATATNDQSGMLLVLAIAALSAFGSLGIALSRAKRGR